MVGYSRSGRSLAESIRGRLMNGEGVTDRKFNDILVSNILFHGMLRLSRNL